MPAPKGWKGINQLATQRAVAYSNRGVIRVLRGNVRGAEEDFLTAIERKANLRLSVPTRNLAKATIDTTAPAVAIVSR